MSREGDRLSREPFEPGTLLLGRYEYVRVLGRGAMGEVLDVRDRRTGQRYALKRIPPELVRNSSQMQAVQTNFNLVQGLTHPHIAVTRFLEADDATGQVYILMDLVRGRDLQTWLEERRYSQSDPAAPLPLPIALGICEQAASALDYAHGKPIYGADGKISRHGILHRDLKPANIMVVDDQQYRPGVPYILLVDFGLAAEIQASLLSSTVHVDGGNLLAGSPLYMAPEQWSGRTLTRAIDQWALAVMLYEMVEGGPPFPGPTRDELRAQAMFQPPLPPEVFSPAQWAAVKTALEKDRTKRHANCLTLVQAVAAADPTPGTIPPASAVTPGLWAGTGSSSGAGSGSGGGSKPLPPAAGKAKDDSTGRWPPTNATTLPGALAAPGSVVDESPFSSRPRRRSRRLGGVLAAAGTTLGIVALAFLWPAGERPKFDPPFGSRVLVRGEASTDPPLPTLASTASTASASSTLAPAATPAGSPLPLPVSSSPAPVATAQSTPFPSPAAAPPGPPPAGPAPVVQSSPARDVESKGVVRFKVDARRAEGGTAGLHYTLAEGPDLPGVPSTADATLDPATGEFVWTAPVVDKPSLHRVWFVVRVGGEGGPASSGHVFIRVWPEGRLNWPQSGGPLWGEVSAAPDLPTKWGPRQNIVWKAECPADARWSAPVIWEDDVWMTTHRGQTWGGLRLSKATGAVRQSVDVVDTSKVERIRYPHDDPPLGMGLSSDAMNLWIRQNQGSIVPGDLPPPAVAAGRVYFHLGRDGAFCLDAADGSILWSNREAGGPNGRRGSGPPLLFGGRLLLPFEGSVGPMVCALDSATGKKVWECALAWYDERGRWPQRRPIVGVFHGVPQLILCGGGAAAAFESVGGIEIWKVDLPKIRRVSALFSAGGSVGVCGFEDVSPLAFDGIQLTDYSSRLNTAKFDPPLFALGGKFDPGPIRNDWPQEQYTTAACSDGVLVVGGSRANGVDFATGDALWSWPLEKARVDQVFIGGRNAYFFCSDLRCGVVDLKTGEVLSVNAFEPELDWHPHVIASERSLYVQATKALFRIEEPPTP